MKMVGTYRMPRLPKPLTSAIAADRLAGGRGITFETHTRVSEKPVHRLVKEKRESKERRERRERMTIRTDIRARHEEHGDVSTGDGSGGGTDDVCDDRAAHGDGEMEEPFPGSICGYQMGNGQYACGSNLEDVAHLRARH